MVKVLSVNGKIPLVDGKAIEAQDGGGSTVELDTTLSKAGKAADAKAVGDAIRSLSDEIANLQTSGLTTAQVNALDGMFKVCAFIKDDISAEYNAFKTAFGIEAATITGISATYSGGAVAVGTAVTDLTGIVVTANYSDGSKRTVTGYTLSGTIAEGSNTITVTYEGMTTTFTVTGVAEEVTLSSISATYSGGDVTVGTAVTGLTGIVVTAHYSDGSTATVTDYTLSGTIAEGENTITVTYDGLTTTFTVTGVAESTSNIISVTWHGVTQITYTTYELNESANTSMSEIIDVTGIDSIKVTTTSEKWTQCLMSTYASADSDYLTIDGTYGIEGSAGTYIQANSDSKADNSVFDVSNYNYISIKIGTYNATMCNQHITVEKVV